jgi:hypothetical protein
MNLKSGRLIKKVYNSGCIGFNISGKFYSLTRLRSCLEEVPEYNLNSLSLNKY